jgi:hypothetical protein
MSQQIKKRLEQIDLSRTLSGNLVRMTWDLKRRGLWVWITPYDDSKATTHYYWEARTDAWFPIQFDNPDHNPLAVHVFDGDSPDDRVILLGGRDGRIRYLDKNGTDDDGRAIENYVFLGPCPNKMLDDLMLEWMQPTFATDAGKVRYDVYVGPNAEDAFNGAFDRDGEAVDGVIHGYFGGGRNPVAFVRQAGFAIYVKLSSTDAWALERLTIKYKSMGAVRRRMYLRPS